MPSPIQSTGASSGTCTFGSSVTVGNLVVVCTAFDFTGTPTYTAGITDNAGGGAGNTYTLAVMENYAGALSKHYVASIYYSVVTIGGAFTVTFTAQASGPQSMAIAEFSYTGPTALDGTNSSTATTGSSLTSNSITTTGAADVIIGVGHTAGAGATWTPGTNFSSWFSSATAPAICAEYQMGVTPGTYAATMTSGVSAVWVCAGAAFIAGGGGVTKYCKLECMGIVRAW